MDSYGQHFQTQAQRQENKNLQRLVLPTFCLIRLTCFKNIGWEISTEHEKATPGFEITTSDGIPALTFGQ